MMKVSDIQVTPLHPERWGNDLDVVNAARVSFGKEATETTDKDVKLINYLAKHKHHSPFNHSFLRFRVKAPIFVARQLVKHKFMPWNEVSRRYVDEEPEFYFPEYWRKKAANVKQGSSDEVVDVSAHAYITKEGPFAAPPHQTLTALTAYNGLLKMGVCAEQARMILPQNTMTEWIWSGTLGAFLDMLVLRLDNHTQKESRDVANAIAKYVKVAFPASYGAYLGNT
jgi:thymidylate synthase (FAD)